MTINKTYIFKSELKQSMKNKKNLSAIFIIAIDSLFFLEKITDLLIKIYFKKDLKQIRVCVCECKFSLM